MSARGVTAGPHLHHRGPPCFCGGYMCTHTPRSSMSPWAHTHTCTRPHSPHTDSHKHGFQNPNCVVTKLGTQALGLKTQDVLSKKWFPRWAASLHCDHARKCWQALSVKAPWALSIWKEPVGVRIFALRAETPASFPQYVHSCKSHFPGAPAGVCTPPSRAFPANQFQCEFSQRSWPEEPVRPA